MPRNAFFLKPSPNLSEALHRMRTRETLNTVRKTEKSLAEIERAIARGPIQFTVEDAIIDDNAKNRH